MSILPKEILLVIFDFCDVLTKTILAFSSKTFECKTLTNDQIYKTAIQDGHLGILKWSTEFQLKNFTNTDSCICAASYGHLNVLEWLCEKENNRVLLHSGNRLCNAAATRGHFGVLKWLRGFRRIQESWIFDPNANVCEWDKDIMESITITGNLKVLQWCYSQGCELTYWICPIAAENGYLDVLKWAFGIQKKKQDTKWEALICSYAAKGGHLQVLKWARENGCEWDSWTSCYGAKARHLEVLKYCIRNECPWY